jgi:hypothetical protein
MVIIETKTFVRIIGKHLTGEEFRLFQVALIENPVAGTIIPGTGGLRKIRWNIPGRKRGKRTGVRIIYFFENEKDRIYMLMAFAKNEKMDLTKEQLSLLAKAVKEELK